MSTRYRTSAVNRDGGEGSSSVPGGLEVRVSSPLRDAVDPDATNPEQLLALAWVTCFNSTAQVIVRGARRTAVRVEVELRDAEPGPGFEFHVDLFFSAEGADAAETERILAATHARCPVSKLLHAAATVQVHAESYAPGGFSDSSGRRGPDRAR